MLWYIFIVLIAATIIIFSCLITSLFVVDLRWYTAGSLKVIPTPRIEVIDWDSDFSPKLLKYGRKRESRREGQYLAIVAALPLIAAHNLTRYRLQRIGPLWPVEIQSNSKAQTSSKVIKTYLEKVQNYLFHFYPDVLFTYYC